MMKSSTMGEPRVLHITVRCEGGGTERNVERLCAATPSFGSLALEDVMGFPLSWSQLPKLRARVKQAQPDVVFCYGAASHLAMTIAFPSPSLPLVGNIRGEIDFTGKKATIRKLIAWRFTDWVANSKKALGDWKGRVIYNGIEIPGDEKPLLTNLPRPVFGVLASGAPIKGHRWLLDLWGRLRPEGSLVFAGNLGDDLKALSESQGVICPGFVDAGRLLRSLDLLLVPSESESMPTVILEAMIRNVPVLATSVGGISEAVTDGQTGLMKPRGDWERTLYELDFSALEPMTTAARKRVETEFSFEKMREDFLYVAREAAS